MLVNTSNENIQLDLCLPERQYQRIKMHRMGADVAITLPRGESKDILPLFGGSLEKTHSILKRSRELLSLSGRVAIYVCDDAGNQVDIDKLLVNTDIIMPKQVQDDISLVEAITTQNRIDDEKRGSAPKSYKKYKRDDLEKLAKKDLIDIAKSVDIVVDMYFSKEQMIETILGLQSHG
jgi:hypothetical protein